MYSTSTFLLCLLAVLGNAPAQGVNIEKTVRIGPNLRKNSQPESGTNHIPRFATVKDHSQEGEAMKNMKAICSCNFADTTTETKPIGGYSAQCAPKAAICGFCMNAAYAAYWSPGEDTCAQYLGEAQDVCYKVAAGTKQAGPEIGKLYEAYGPTFGASSVWCKSQSCCPNRESMGFPAEKLS